AVEHRLALLEERGDVARLKTERLTLQAPREEQRARYAEAECESDVPSDHRHPPKDRRVHLVLEKTDRDDADDPLLRVKDRHLRPHRPPERALLDPDPGLTLERRRGIGRNALADLLGVRMRVANDVDVRDGDERRGLALL